MTELNPCPICKGVAKLNKGNKGRWKTVECTSCGYRLAKGVKTYQEAIDAWNGLTEGEPRWRACPFCGRTPTEIKNCNNVPIGLRCLNCSLDMVCEDYRARWNRRADDDADMLALFNGWLDSERYDCDNSEHD